MILVVDDNDDSLQLISKMLATNGFEVATAQNGKEGLTSALKSPPQLIILDIMMPEMNGLEALEELRKHPSTSGVPVILLTAKSHDADVIEGYRVGADYYMTKPFTSKQLLYGVRLVLGLPQTA